MIVWTVLRAIFAHTTITVGAAFATNIVLIGVLKWAADHGGVGALTAWISATRAKERDAALAKMAQGLELPRVQESDAAKHASDLATGIAEWNRLDAWERRRIRALSLGKPSYVAMWLWLIFMGIADRVAERTFFTTVAGLWFVSLLVFVACAVSVGLLAYDHGSPPAVEKKPPSNVRVDPTTQADPRVEADPPATNKNAEHRCRK